MGVEQKLGNMGVVTTTLGTACNLGTHQRHVADAVRTGLLRNRDDVGAGRES